jgi:endonuclease YncB( thermonuclease family)
MQQRKRRKGPLTWSNQQIARGVVIAIGLLVAALFGNPQNLGRETAMPEGGAVEGRPRLVDGDSFFIGQTEVRMQGIDAPEGRQNCQREGRDWPCGEEARRTLARLIGSQPVSCRVTERDQHGRLLAYCSSGGRDLNQQMVALGYAVAFGNYEAEERAAKAAKKGMWSGQFQRPRDWRREHNPPR